MQKKFLKFREQVFPNFLFFIIFIITATTNIITINDSTSISIIIKNKVKKITRKKIIIISFKKLIFGL